MKHDDIFNQAERIGQELDQEYYDLLERVFSKGDSDDNFVYGDFQKLNNKKSRKKMAHNENLKNNPQFSTDKNKAKVS